MTISSVPPVLPPVPPAQPAAVSGLDNPVIPRPASVPTGLGAYASLVSAGTQPSGPAALVRPSIVDEAREIMVPQAGEIDLLFCRALGEVGITSFNLATGFDRDGEPLLLVTADKRTHAFSLRYIPENDLGDIGPYRSLWSDREKVASVTPDGVGGFFEVTQPKYLLGSIARYDQDGRLLWQHTFDSTVVLADPQYAPGEILVYGREHLHRFNAKTGQIVGSISSSGYIPSGPIARWGDEFFIPTRDGIIRTALDGSPYTKVRFPVDYGSDSLKSNDLNLSGLAVDPITGHLFMALGQGVYAYHFESSTWYSVQLPDMPDCSIGNTYGQEVFLHVNGFHLDPNSRSLYVMREKYNVGNVYQRVVHAISPQDRVLTRMQSMPLLGA